LAGLVYLDAIDDPGDFPGKNPAYRALFDKLPGITPARASDADKKSFQAFLDWRIRTMRFRVPESEWRNVFEANPDGSVGPPRASNSVIQAIDAGSKKRDYRGIRVPVLAIVAPDDVGNEWSQRFHFQPKNDEERAALREIYAADRVYGTRYEEPMRAGVSDARIVELPGADHFVFFTNEADVLREMRIFLAGLP
jgi:non-heme chloroperoxidase